LQEQYFIFSAYCFMYYQLNREPKEASGYYVPDVLCALGSASL
jgi:hypothetical protein